MEENCFSNSLENMKCKHILTAASGYTKMEIENVLFTIIRFILLPLPVKKTEVKNENKIFRKQ